MFKKIFIVLFVIGAVTATVLIFKDDLKNDPGFGAIQRDIADIKEKVFAPEPLRLKSSGNLSVLTVAGIISETNKERTTQNIPSLKESAALRKAAELKINDMFARQYFEHESPSGEGPADLAEKEGYDYVIIGENLALGNFGNDALLVDGWMESPGHRENILRPAYTEIGVAVKRGMFEGKMTWLAVQEFGTPSSSCPGPDTALGGQIDQGKAELSRQEPILEEKKKAVDNFRPKRGPEYQAKVEEYNNVINQYNTLVTEIKKSVELYNQQADAYNECLASFSK